MIPQTRVLDLEIDRMKTPKLLLGLILAVLCINFVNSFIILLVFLLTFSIGILGPKELIIDKIANAACENELKFAEDSNPQATDNQRDIESYKCIVCKEFHPTRNRKITSLRLEIYSNPEDLSQFEELETNFNVSLLESKHITSTCQNLALLSSKNSFPTINNELLHQPDKEHKDLNDWELVLNNQLFDGAPACDSEDEKSKCIIDIYGDTYFKEATSKIAIMLEVRLSKEQIEKIDELSFQLIYTNTRFYSTTSAFLITISISSILVFIYILPKLAQYKAKDWVGAHKWIVILLLTQPFLNGFLSIMNNLVQNEAISFLSEFGKNIHLGLFLCFWLSAYDHVLLQNMAGSEFNEWSDKIKVTLVSCIFILNCSYNIYIQIESMENDYKYLFQLRFLLNLIQFLITSLVIIYMLYFIGLTLLIVKLTRGENWEVNKASAVLLIFNIISFALSIISLCAFEQSFAYIAIQGYAAIYIAILAILYVPYGKRNRITQIEISKITEPEHSIKVDESVNETPEEQDEDKDQETPPTKPIQKLVWERIEKEEETKQPVKTIKEEAENEEYIYL